MNRVEKKQPATSPAAALRQGVRLGVCGGSTQESRQSPEARRPACEERLPYAYVMFQTIPCFIAYFAKGTLKKGGLKSLPWMQMNLQFSCLCNKQTRSCEDMLMQQNVEELETIAHVTAAHSSAPHHGGKKALKQIYRPIIQKLNLKISPDQSQTRPPSAMSSLAVAQYQGKY